VTGRRIGPYELSEVLGEGGIGQVYAARDTVLGRQVAVKMLRPELSRDRSFITRFYNEAQSLGDLGHANITTLYALHLEGQEPFMVMELVHGHTLEALLARVHRVPLRASLAVVAQAVAGLAFAHRRGVIHRDVKPSNLMMTDTGILKIMDFGIARMRGTRRLTRAGQMFGTLLYASPEQIKGGDVDERSDVYSLAIVLYEMLAGRPPFTAENEHALMTAHLQTPPPPLTERLRDLDPQIDSTLFRALAKTPEERFATVEEFGRALGAMAIRGDAADILQDFITPVFRDAPSSTRLVNAPSDVVLKRNARGSKRGTGAPRSEHGRQSASLSWLTGLPSGMRLPIAAFAGVTIALALGLAYLAGWPIGSAHFPQQAAIEKPKLPPQAPLQSAPPLSPAPAVGMLDSPRPVTQQQPQSPAPISGAPSAAAVASATPLPQSPPTNSVELSRPIPQPPPQFVTPIPSPSTSMPTPVVFPSSASTSEPSLMDLKPAFKPTSPPQPETSIAALEPPSQPKPAIQGTVSRVTSASKIWIGEKPVDLYGINDPTERVHTRDVIEYLKPSHGVVECYEKAGDRYQCYANGKDLAELALRSGLARVTPDAPAEYRNIAPQPTSARH
jgi:serine/threonine protein kinase